MSNRVVFTKSLSAAVANNIAQAQNPGTAALTLNGAAVTAGVATIDTYNSASNIEIGRRVLISSVGDDHAISWTVVGTNAAGQPISETFAGALAGQAAQSNLDFVTVTSITPSGATAGNVTAGTSGVGSTRWMSWHWTGTAPFAIGFAVELVSGAANFTVQHTYDDPNNLLGGALFPLPFNSPVATGAAATVDGAYTTPIVATRLLINSGTGVLRARFLQSGIG